jgi:hypothetical protein
LTVAYQMSLADEHTYDTTIDSTVILAFIQYN